MGRRIVAVMVLLATLIGGYAIWKHHNDTQELANGDVHCDGCMSPEEHARFVKENAGETADGGSDRKNKTAREEAATDFQDSAAAAGSTQSNPSSASLPAAAARSAAAPSQSAAAPSQTTSMQPQSQPAFTLTNSVNPATGDTLPANAENGLRFAGSGTYQWYRQGNLTWRVDTASGRSCIIYATMEEWRKPIVISHGCGRNA